MITGDCEWVSEVFQRRLDRRVLDWHFGAGSEELAFFELRAPADTDTKLEMEVDNHVTKHGVVLSVASVAERYGRTHEEPTPGDKAQDSRGKEPGVGGDAVETPLGGGGEVKMGDLPKAEDGEEAAGANVFNSMQARDLRGQWTEGGGGGGGGGSSKGTGRPEKPVERESIREVVQVALSNPDARDYVLYAEISDEQSARIADRTSSVVDLTGYQRMLGAGEVNKVINKHAKDQRPVVVADFESLTERLEEPHRQWWEARKGRPQVLVSLIKEPGGTMRIIEEQRVGRKYLTLISMYRP